MKLRSINKTGLVLRIIGTLFLASGIITFLFPALELTFHFNKSSVGGGVDFFDIENWFFNPWTSGFLALGFSILLLRKTYRSLRIAQFVIIGFFLTIVAGLFITSGGVEGNIIGFLGYLILSVFVYSLVYIPAIVIYLLISFERSKIKKVAR